jgi:DNA-binding NarL/FixJ family response regulator
MEAVAVAVSLTDREREVLTLVASGKSTKILARELGITFRTAACHRYHIQQKLGARNTADLTRAAIRMHLIEV